MMFPSRPAFLGLTSILALLHLTPVAAGKKSCHVTSSNGAADDSPSFVSALSNCSSDGVVVFDAGLDYNIFTPVKASNLTNVEIQLLGNLHLPQNITEVSAIVNASGGNVYWLSFSGTNLNFTGTRNVSSGWIYSYGQAWWDANPMNGTGLDGRPHLLAFNAQGGVITNFKASQPIAWCVSLSGNDILVQNVLIDATTNGSFPFNTDGFDIGSTNTLIEDAVVLNGDDAFTVENGAHNVTVRNALIGGPGCHGTSVGSLGEDLATLNSVSNILFTDITAVGCVYGARFKSYQGGQGLAKNITWQNFHVHNVTYPIYVTQNYVNQGSPQTQNGNGSATDSGRPNNSSVLMQDFTYSNWKGTINTYNPGDWSCVSDPCWYTVPGSDGTQSVVIQCDTETSCSGYQLFDISVVPTNGLPPSTLCSNLNTDSNPNMGFVCQNGTFIQTSSSDILP